MAESKNEIFENAWKLYKNKATRVRMEKFLPGVARLFSSGNKTLAEQEFNAEMLSSLKGESLYANEMAWIANGKIPSSTIQDIFSDKKANRGKIKATETFLNNLSGMATLYFSGNPEAAQNAENFFSKVNDFMEEGYDEPTAKIYAMPTSVFRQLNKDIDSRAGYKYSGKDNRVHSVAEDFAARRKSKDGIIDDSLKTEDLVELAKMFGGNLSNTVDDNTNLAKLDESARELGFTSANELFDFLAVSEDRSRRLREQDDDGLATRVAKEFIIPAVNEKWNDGVPSNYKDVAHDVALAAVELAPQNEILAALKSTKPVADAISAASRSSKTFNNFVKTSENPAVKLVMNKAVVPSEAAYIDALHDDNGEGIDWLNVGKSTVGAVLMDSYIDSKIRGLTKKFNPATKDFKGSSLISGKERMKDLEKRAYDIAYEYQAVNAAHNAMIKTNFDSRQNPVLVKERLRNNKAFNKNYPMSEQQFSRVFNEAYDLARREFVGPIPNELSRELNASLKNLESYKKTRDFKNALQAAAWEEAGLNRNGILQDIRREKYPGDFMNSLPEGMDFDTYSSLMKMYENYSKKRTGADKVINSFKWNAYPKGRDYFENLMTVNQVYSAPFRYLLNAAGLKKEDNNSKKR